MRRRTLIFIPILIVIVVVIAIAVVLGRVDRFRPRVQAELQQKLDRQVTLGHLGLRLFPLSIRVDGLTIAESPEFPAAQPFATAKEVFVSVSLMSLIRGNPDVKVVDLDRPQVDLIRNSAGVWNFSTLGTKGASGTQPQGAKATSGTQPQSVTSTSGAQSEQFSLDELKITDGQVALTDQLKKEARAVYDHIDLRLTHFEPNKQFGLDLAIHFPGQGKELLTFNGEAGPLPAGNATAIPVSGHLSVQQVSLSAVNHFSPGAVPPNTDSVVSADATVAPEGEALACKGNLKLENTVIHGTKISYPVDAQYDVIEDPKQDTVQIRSGTVKLGSTPFSMSGNIDAARNPTALNVQLSTTNSSITELAQVAGAFSGGSNPTYPVKGIVSAVLDVKGPVTAMQVSAKAKLSGVDTNALLSALSSLKDTLYGSLEADAVLSSTIQSNADLAHSLNGSMNFNVTNGQLKNVNILSELSRIGKFLNSAPAASGSGTALKRFSGTFDIVNGVATTNNLIATLDAGSLAAKGSLNLVNEGIDMHMTAVLASGASQSVGGTGIGGFLNTALANKQGELVLPVQVTGTMAHPVFTPDVQALAKMRLSNLLPTSGDPSKLTTGLIGSALGNKGAGGILGQFLGNPAAQQTNQQQKNQQQNPVGSLLKQFEKKKPPK